MSSQAFEITTEKARIDVAMVHEFLVTSYWATGRPRAMVEQTIRNSVCFGGFLDSRQIAFGRVVTDSATFAYFADIFVQPGYQGRGYGRAIVTAMLEFVDSCGVFCTVLGTRDAAGLYEKFGFVRLAPGDPLMKRSRKRAENAV